MPKVLTIVFLAFYVYVILSSITVILLENRNPAKSLSWILVLIFLPGVGLVLYIAIGQDYRKQKFVDKNTIQHLIDRPVASFDLSRLDTSYMDNNQLNLINLLYRNSGAAGYAFNKIDILSDGAATFDSLFDAIEGARDHIHIEFFIFADDEISNRLRELLIRKARAGGAGAHDIRLLGQLPPVHVGPVHPQPEGGGRVRAPLPAAAPAGGAQQDKLPQPPQNRGGGRAGGASPAGSTWPTAISRAITSASGATPWCASRGRPSTGCRCSSCSTGISWNAS